MTPARTLARQTAFQFVYRYDTSEPPTHEALRTEVLLHFQHFKIAEESRDFALRLILATLQNLPTIDELAKQHLQNWRMERMGAVERSLLRLSVAELLYFKDVPSSVTLDETIELAKFFGSEDSASFLNGVLEPISQLPHVISGKVPSDSRK